MKRKTLVLSALVSAWSLSAGYALAGDPQTAKEEAQVQKPEQVYGSQRASLFANARDRSDSGAGDPARHDSVTVSCSRSLAEAPGLRKADIAGGTLVIGFGESRKAQAESARDSCGFMISGSVAARGPKNLYDGFQPRSGHWHEVLGRLSSGRPVNAVSRR
jgi:hypothetical protein